MRKDVKLGLAVGGILFVVVLVYVLFLAGDKPRNQQVRNIPGGTDPAGMTPQPGSEPAMETAGPATQPAQPVVNIDVGGTPYPIVNPTTQPAQPPVETAAAAGGTFNWREALERGAGAELLARSTTPTSPPPSDLVAPLRGSPGTTGLDNVIPIGATSIGNGRTYVVKPGESFWSIAKRELGSAAYVPQLEKANPGVNSGRVRAGTPIIIPDRQSLPAAKVETPAPRATDPSREYVVKPGDNLNVICRTLYGRIEKTRVDQLYELNKQLIGPNPSVLKPNMVLRLPEAPASPAPPPASASGSVVPEGTLAGPLQ